MQDAKGSLERLHNELAPILRIQRMKSTSGNPSTKTMLDIIEELIQGATNLGHSPTQVGHGERLSYEEMQKTIHHFMKLFDVRAETAVYTRIHDLYVRYFEMLNAFHSLRQILHFSK